MKITKALENSKNRSQAVELMKADKTFELSVKDANQFISSIADVLEMIEELTLLVQEYPNEEVYIKGLADTTKELNHIIQVYLGTTPTNR